MHIAYMITIYCIYVHICVALYLSVRQSHLMKINIYENIIGRSLKLYHSMSICLYLSLLHSEKIWAYGHGIIEMTGRARCQRQVAFF